MSCQNYKTNDVDSKGKPFINWILPDNKPNYGTRRPPFYDYKKNENTKNKYKQKK